MTTLAPEVEASHPSRYVDFHARCEVADGLSRKKGCGRGAANQHDAAQPAPNPSDDSRPSPSGAPTFPHTRSLSMDPEGIVAKQWAAGPGAVGQAAAVEQNNARAAGAAGANFVHGLAARNSHAATGLTVPHVRQMYNW